MIIIKKTSPGLAIVILVSIAMAVFAT